MSKIVSKQDFFFEMEARDEQQMLSEYEGRVMQEITYKVQGQTAISYDGIKFLANKLGYIKVLSVEAEFIEKPVQMWVATVLALNEKYQLQMPGAGEQEYMMKKKDGSEEPDPFARRKAISKATRNAVRAVIPEPMIIKFLDDVAAGKIKPQQPIPPEPRYESQPVEDDGSGVFDLASLNSFLLNNDIGLTFKDQALTEDVDGILTVRSPPGSGMYDKANKLLRELNFEWIQGGRRWERTV